MFEEKYSSGMISQSFWFVETKKIIQLVNDGMILEDIRALCIEENFFGMGNSYRAKRMFGYIWTRVSKLDDTMIKLFCDSDLATQKIINLISIMKSDKLFFEFLYEVYREKVILGSQVLEESDVKVFFSNKEKQNDDITVWTDGTKKRLRSCYFNFLMDANLLALINKEKVLTPPILDIALERYLEATGEYAIVKAITGVN